MVTVKENLVKDFFNAFQLNFYGTKKAPKKTEKQINLNCKKEMHSSKRFALLATEIFINGQANWLSSTLIAMSILGHATSFCGHVNTNS